MAGIFIKQKKCTNKKLFCSMSKKYLSLKTPTAKIVLENIHSIKNYQNNLPEMYTVQI